jgi:hypothetical protein
VAWDKTHVSVGGLLGTGLFWEESLFWVYDYFWEKDLFWEIPIFGEKELILEHTQQVSRKQHVEK